MSAAPPLDAAAFSARIAQLRLRDLVMLEYLYQTGSLRGTAECLHVTQPAITKALQGVEDAFGCQLVERCSTGVHFTAAGVVTLERLRAARNEVVAAAESAQSGHGMVLRVGATPMALQHVVPDALSCLSELHPEVRVSVVEAGAPVLWRQLSEGALDAVVGPLPRNPASTAIPSGVACFPIGRERMHFIASRTHAGFSEGSHGARHLAAQRWVLPTQESWVSVMVAQWFSEQGVEPPSPVIVCPSFYSNLRLVGQTDLITAAPESAIDLLAPKLKLMVVKVNVQLPSPSLLFGCRCSGQRQTAISALRALLENPKPNPFAKSSARNHRPSR